MSLVVRDNEREPWSRITDSRILLPRDELKLVGVGFTAIVGVLDAHDPSAEIGPTLGQLIGIEGPHLPNHHHVLVQVEGRSEVLPTGLHVGVGDPEELIFAHVSRRHFGDEAFGTRLRRLHAVLETGSHGLYFMSDQEPLSATPEGQTYLNPQGGLLI